MSNKKPVVLCFSGHDPTGGAGIQADIEAISQHDCHTCSVITALTTQDTSNVLTLIPQEPEHILQQAKILFSDIKIDVIKIGLIGHFETAIAIHALLCEHPDIPIVLDPVLAAGGGKQLSSQNLIDAINDLLLPRTSIITPNNNEARQLSGDLLLSTEQCAKILMKKGCQYVLITGADEDTSAVENQLFYQFEKIKNYHWQRLPYSYHGSGCTLAATIAALLATGIQPLDAIFTAQQYTWNSLKAGFKPGHGQHLPNRFYNTTSS